MCAYNFNEGKESSDCEVATHPNALLSVFSLSISLLLLWWVFFGTLILSQPPANLDDTRWTLIGKQNHKEGPFTFEGPTNPPLPQLTGQSSLWARHEPSVLQTHSTWKRRRKVRIYKYSRLSALALCEGRRSLIMSPASTPTNGPRLVLDVVVLVLLFGVMERMPVFVSYKTLGLSIGYSMRLPFLVNPQFVDPLAGWPLPLVLYCQLSIYHSRSDDNRLMLMI